MKMTTSSVLGHRHVLGLVCLLTVQAVCAHPDSEQTVVPNPTPGPSAPPNQTDRTGSINQASEVAACTPRLRPEPFDFVEAEKSKRAENRDYLPKITVRTGFVTHLHAPDPSRAEHLRVVPNGQFAELWYLASQRWLDQAASRVCYCVFPRIEVIGRQAWSTEFQITLVEQLPGGATRQHSTVLVDVAPPKPPIAPGSSRQLGSPSQWCTARDASAGEPKMLLVTPYGTKDVDFGVHPANPVNGPGLIRGTAPLPVSRPASTP